MQRSNMKPCMTTRIQYKTYSDTGQQTSPKVSVVYFKILNLRPKIELVRLGNCGCKYTYIV